MPDSTVVLIVDDEVLIQDLLEGAFIDAGYEVRLLSSGSEAMTFLGGCAHCPQALVTDIDLGAAPSGWDVGRRAREVSPGIAVIYMSGDSVQEWERQGVADSLMFGKPFATGRIVAAMTSLLDASERDSPCLENARLAGRAGISGRFTEAPMSPAELKRLNIEYFQRVLDRATSAEERLKIEGFISEERGKPDSAYPADQAIQKPH